MPQYILSLQIILYVVCFQEHTNEVFVIPSRGTGHVTRDVIDNNGHIYNNRDVIEEYNYLLYIKHYVIRRTNFDIINSNPHRNRDVMENGGEKENKHSNIIDTICNIRSFDELTMSPVTE